MFGSLTRRLEKWHMRQITRRRLAHLDSRLLADIGAKPDDFVAVGLPMPYLGLPK